MKNGLRTWILSLVLLVLAGLEMIWMRMAPAFFFPWYRNSSKILMGALAGLFSFTRYSVWDVGAAALLLIFLIALIRCIRRKQGFVSLLRRTILIVSVLVLIAMHGWLGNHYAPKLSAYLNLEVRQYSTQELYEAAEAYLMEAASLAPQIERNNTKRPLPSDFYETARIAGSSYTALSKTWPVFEGSSVPVKRFSLIGEYLLYNGIIGMFMPVTGEASVPRNVPIIPLPFTMCHEAAHRLGIASEQEANFCAFLACMNSDDLYFRYSGAYSAFGYCWNALVSADPDSAKKLYETYKMQEGVTLVFMDRQDTRAAYAKYDSPLQDVSDNINDTYLKTFSHESGIRSYGEVTDYLIAWHQCH